MAIHAGLQTDYILYRTKKVLKPGDIVVLPFEYQMLTWNGEDDDTRTDYILTHDKEFFFSDLTLGQQLSMIYSISIKDFLKSIEQQLKTPSKSKNGEGYTSDTLNKNGDETLKVVLKIT